MHDGEGPGESINSDPHRVGLGVLGLAGPGSAEHHQRLPRALSGLVAGGITAFPAGPFGPLHRYMRVDMCIEIHVRNYSGHVQVRAPRT